jgi:hypothetical protein
MLYLWWRMRGGGAAARVAAVRTILRLMVCGSCFGAVTWAARMMASVNGFKPMMHFRDAICSRLVVFCAFYSWAAVFAVTYAIEFLCLSAAKLMVLDRMSDFAAGQDEGARKRWAAGGRVVMAVVVLGNAVGLAANVAAAVHGQRAAEASSTASAFFAANRTQEAFEFVLSSQKELQLPSPSQPCSRGAKSLCCCSLSPRLL